MSEWVSEHPIPESRSRRHELLPAAMWIGDAVMVAAAVWAVASASASASAWAVDPSLEDPALDYCSLCDPPGTHTVCLHPDAGPSANCTGYKYSPLSSREKRAIVRTHNVVRSRVAMGQAWSRAGVYPAQPPASDMREMHWDKELEWLAQRWADQCLPFYTEHPHDDCRDTFRFPVGQNIVTTAYSRPAHSDVRARTLDWYGEMKYFNPQWVTSFQTNPDPDPKHQVGHYTQMVWGWSYAIGCARVIFQEEIETDSAPWTVERIVCNYAPSGNFLRTAVYRPGAPCSACPPGTACSERYPGLCTLVEYGEVLLEDESEWSSQSLPENSQNSSAQSEPTKPWFEAGVEVTTERDTDIQRILEDTEALENGTQRPSHFSVLEDQADSSPTTDSPDLYDFAATEGNAEETSSAAEESGYHHEEQASQLESPTDEQEEDTSYAHSSL